VIEQITFLLFLKRLDDLHTLEESKAEMLGAAMERQIFPGGSDDKGEPYAQSALVPVQEFRTTRD